jgi:hypothetical protein
MKPVEPVATLDGLLPDMACAEPAPIDMFQKKMPDALLGSRIKPMTTFA